MAIFNPALHGHGGIVGSTGTGKTTGAAFTMTAAAVKAGYHVILLDPDGGQDWGVFRQHTEWMETDRDMLPDQIMALNNEYLRRADGGRYTPLLVVIEEYGDLIKQLRSLHRQEAENVDTVIDAILRRGRRRGVHVLLVDQYPEYWSQQVIAGVKWRAVHRLGPNQGAKLEEYNVSKLPNRGAFRHDGQQYEAWHAAPAMRQLLATMPAQTFTPIVDAQFQVVHERHERHEQAKQGGNAVNRAAVNAVPAPVDDWYNWTLSEHQPMHPDMLELDSQGRGMGVRVLAEAMAVLARGNAAQYEDFKGVASEVGKRLRSEVRLAAGGAFGIDVSREEYQ